MKKAFTDLERNRVKKFDTVVIPLRPHITGSEFQEIISNIDAHLRDGRPVILKLFGDLNSQSPIFRTEDMRFEPGVEEQLIDWMKKPMIFIGYSFSDKIIEEILISSRGSAPIFLVDPSLKKCPTSIKKLNRVYHIQKTFSEFILDLLEIFKDRKPDVIEKTEKILASLGALPELLSIRSPAETLKPGISPKKKDGVQMILFLAANPQNTPRLRLDEENREIRESLQRAKNRSKFKLETRPAVRYPDLRKALLDYEPQIVHFSGHGKRNGLFLENKEGMYVLISTQVLSGLFELCASHIECVILNSCYSASQAQAIGKHIGCVIGLPREIKDEAAVGFSVGFYDALGAGKS
ncbi:MAG: CHAT domain-containing protein, partial [Candidatus Aminicenantes bacterium]|nr:CHAT domain-containing protein [Candidatus Aminicenantes bacterium]